MMSRGSAFTLLLVGLFLFFGSCASLGYSLYLNWLMDPAYTEVIDISKHVAIDNIRLSQGKLARIGVKGSIVTESVQEKTEGGETDYIPRYQFPVIYTVTDQYGQVIQKDFTRIEWNSGSRATSNEQVDSLGGSLDLTYSFEKFSVPDSGLVNISIKVDPDQKYNATLNQPILVVFDGLADDRWLIGGGIVSLMLGIIMFIVGFVFFLSVYAGSNTDMSCSTEDNLSLQDVSADERHKALLIHISGLSGYLLPLGNVIVPLVLWLLWRDKSAYLNAQGLEAVNFQLSVLIYLIISLVLLIVLIGFLLLIGVSIFHLTLSIIAAIKSSQGVNFRYPMIIHLIK